MKRLFLFAVIISAATLAGFWATQRVYRLMPHSSLKAASNWHAFSRLGPAQRKAVQELDDSFRRDSDAVCMRICEERLNLMRMLENPQEDRNAVHRKVEEIGALQTTLEKKISDHILEVKKHLDPADARAYLGVIRQQIQRAIRQNGFQEILRP